MNDSYLFLGYQEVNYTNNDGKSIVGIRCHIASCGNNRTVGYDTVTVFWISDKSLCETIRSLKIGTECACTFRPDFRNNRVLLTDITSV